MPITAPSATPATPIDTALRERALRVTPVGRWAIALR